MTTTRTEELLGTGVGFVQATVVRAQAPSSAHAGDHAIVLADGSIEGFVGGHCVTESVRTVALSALRSGESVLLRVLPDGREVFPESPGASIVVNPCLSGGALEIYLEPSLPAPVLQVVGTSPIAEALAALAPALGLVVGAADEPGLRAATAVVISTHGGDEAGAVRAALDAGVGFVGVVCSHTRGAGLLQALDLSDEEAARVHPHVGLDIGARTAPEVGLSILAAVVRAIRLEGLCAPAPMGVDTTTAVAPTTAVDPVCGMTVTIGPDTARATVDGVEYSFCMPGCRTRFLEEHAS